MPTKYRYDDDVNADELARRARWGGLEGIPPLTPDEQARWRAIQEASDSWVPGCALAYCWSHIDPVHGRGRWVQYEFYDALKVDRQEIVRVTARHPEQAPRLKRWVDMLEALGRERGLDGADSNRGDHSIGRYYERLIALGYDGTRAERAHGNREGL
jgi:hypothetical protein